MIRLRRSSVPRAGGKGSRARRWWGLTLATSALTLPFGWLPHTGTRPPWLVLTKATTISTIESYFAAYNRHDLHAVLAILAPHPVLADCDYVHGLYNPALVSEYPKTWLQRKFEEGDRFSRVNVIVNPGPNYPHVAGADTERTSDVLSAEGAAPLGVGFKITLNAAGQIDHMLAGAPCEGLYGSLSPAIRAREVARWFLDA